MKLLIALAALFTFLVACFWFSTPDGYLGAGDLITTGFTQAQDGEQQHQDLANPGAESLINFPNERTFTNYDGQSVLDSQPWYSAMVALQRYEGNIRHHAYRYKPGLLDQARYPYRVYLHPEHRPENRLTI